jgi:putative Holliday junction resolvase
MKFHYCINKTTNFAKTKMGRILAIDYGQKRVGIAVTDELQLIANSLTTVAAKDILIFLKDYILKEKVDFFVVGEPKQMNNLPSESAKYIEPFIKQLKKQFPEIEVKRIDERFTSKIASQTMLTAGLKKKDRQNKEMIDTISACIILQSYLETKNRF